MKKKIFQTHEAFYAPLTTDEKRRKNGTINYDDENKTYTAK